MNTSAIHEAPPFDQEDDAMEMRFATTVMAQQPPLQELTIVNNDPLENTQMPKSPASKTSRTFVNVEEAYIKKVTKLEQDQLAMKREKLKAKSFIDPYAKGDLESTYQP